MPWALVETVVAPPSVSGKVPALPPVVVPLLVPDEEEPMSDDVPVLLWAAALSLVPDEEPRPDDVPAL